MENTGIMKSAVNLTTINGTVVKPGPKKRLHIKEPGSAITHFIGMVMAIFASIPLLICAAAQPDRIYILSMAVYAASLILLYAASTTYHTFDISEKTNTILKKIDHMMISVLIAGSYTPVCLLVLKGRTGIILLSIVWGIAIAGILIKAFWVYCPKWVSSVLYIGMGWTCVLAFTQLLDSLSPGAFGWLLAGGIIYTAGGVIYALKLPLFNSRHKNFGSHEIFHLFVMAGSACHFVVMYAYLRQAERDTDGDCGRVLGKVKACDTALIRKRKLSEQSEFFLFLIAFSRTADLLLCLMPCNRNRKHLLPAYPEYVG